MSISKKLSYHIIGLLIIIALFNTAIAQTPCTNPPAVGFIVDSVNYSSYSRIFTDTSNSTANIIEYNWDFGNNDSLKTDTVPILYKYSDAGTYTVTLQVTDNNGCSSTSTTTVIISDIFNVPNVFTPNGDNINDNFIVTTNGINKFSITVYSRWGKQVFTREGQQQIVWDGKLPNGKLVPVATYYYVISVEDSNAAYEPEKGFVSVFY